MLINLIVRILSQHIHMSNNHFIQYDGTFKALNMVLFWG